ncbi:MAG: hypothetical protein EXQ71_05935 [Acidimicrobiia bacterium]|nr:hypothetical protein [Acidimicrobiia bacterium]
MSDPAGWQPISGSSSTPLAFQTSPFARLARAHALSSAGDVLVAIALANSLFFDLDPNDARWKVFLYLALTVAPLALVSPLIGPALDRSVGARRWVIVGVNAVRAFACLMMIGDLSGLLLFPEAFLVLAMGKVYGVTRAALVPTVVHGNAGLVEANAKLQLLSGLAVPVMAIPAAIAFALGGSEGILLIAALAYAGGTYAAIRIPPTRVADAPATAAEVAELRGIGVILAAQAMSVIRGLVGFLAFLLLFSFRDGPYWHLWLVLGLSGLGTLAGAGLAPVLRRTFTEERMLTASLAVAAGVGAVAAWRGTIVWSALLAGSMAAVASTGRLAFDSLVQRDAPDANRGRSFARFELRFQAVWVVGASIPVLVPIPLRVGYAAIGLVAALSLCVYLSRVRVSRRAGVDRRPAGPGIPPDQHQPAEAVVGTMDGTALRWNQRFMGRHSSGGGDGAVPSTGPGERG